MAKLTPFSLFIKQALKYPLESPFLPPAEKVEKNFSYANGALIGLLEAGGGGPSYHFPRDRVLVDNGDGTISDLVSGLMWPKDFKGVACFNGGVDEYDNIVSALANTVNDPGFAGYTDWRIPAINELLTIINYGGQMPLIFSDYFVNFPGEIYGYWSSTIFPYGSDRYFTLQLDAGLLEQWDKEGMELGLFPVRTITE